jgi:hypothetical protein
VLSHAVPCFAVVNRDRLFDPVRLQDKAARVAALGYVVGNSDGDYTSETRHRSVPLGFIGDRVRRRNLSESLPS